MYIEQCEHFQLELKIPPQMERNYFVSYCKDSIVCIPKR